MLFRFTERAIKLTKRKQNGYWCTLHNCKHRVTLLCGYDVTVLFLLRTAQGFQPFHVVLILPQVYHTFNFPKNAYPVIEKPVRCLLIFTIGYTAMQQSFCIVSMGLLRCRRRPPRNDGVAWVVCSSNSYFTLSLNIFCADYAALRPSPWEREMLGKHCFVLFWVRSKSEHKQIQGTNAMLD
jgi:hypothetical protein